MSDPKQKCHQCRYFKLTWEEGRPYACGFHGFKGKKMPNLVVRESSGIDCRFFDPKSGKASASADPKSSRLGPAFIRDSEV